MRTLLVALVLMLPSSALAETPRWVQITATVAGSLVGEVVGAPLGAIAYDAVDPYGLGAECAADPDPLACEGSTLHVLGVGGPPGAAVVGTLGAVAGHALAGGERSGEVALVTGATALVSSGLVVTTPVHESSGLWVLGTSGALVGVPVAAGVVASKGPRSEPEVTVVPRVSRSFQGLVVAGRF